MDWENRLRHLATKHGFDMEATEFMADAIRRSGGRSAQWKHPGLGGFGQWMPGMTTISPRDTALEKRLDELCMDVMRLLQEKPGGGGLGASGSTTLSRGTNWWPETLGSRPNSAGAQNAMRYAYFADARRLAVDRGDGQVTVYDTGDHEVHGVSQAQGTGRADRLVFRSQRGEVDLAALTVVEVPGD